MKVLKMLIDVLTKTDQLFIDQAKLNTQEFEENLKVKSNINGFKWDDFVLEFEWRILEKAKINKFLETVND